MTIKRCQQSAIDFADAARFLRGWQSRRTTVCRYLEVFIIAFAVSALLAAPVLAATQKKRVSESQLLCGQKLLVAGQSCPKGEILEVTGSCREMATATGMVGKGLQYNCIRRK
jgi:hypothetical protein